jgi:drug/metabolite transporter (DMT)-like permease
MLESTIPPDTYTAKHGKSIHLSRLERLRLIFSVVFMQSRGGKIGNFGCMEASPPRDRTTAETKLGMLLVAGSATVWSFGGAIARFLSVTDSWTVVFWRATWAGVFLLCFLIMRDGLRGAPRLFQTMGLPGVGVALCFATASTTFVVALSFTTVANIMLIQAGAPLLAALFAWLLFRERVAVATWIAIAAVILGVAIMVSESLVAQISLAGNLLALLIASAFALATVLTRRYASVRMMPAGCLGAAISACLSAALAKDLSVTAPDMTLLFMFGALNLGLGLALFTTGARLVPSAIAALIGTVETIIAPVWVWLIHNEVPSRQTILGGTIVLLALISHFVWQYRRQRSYA